MGIVMNFVLTEPTYYWFTISLQTGQTALPLQMDLPKMHFGDQPLIETILIGMVFSLSSTPENEH